MKQKSEAFAKFKKFKALVEQEKGTKIKTLRTDRGGRVHLDRIQPLLRDLRNKTTLNGTIFTTTKRCCGKKKQNVDGDDTEYSKTYGCSELHVGRSRHMQPISSTG